MTRTTETVQYPLWWQPIITLTPEDNQVQLKGPSGYNAPFDTHTETGHMRTGGAIYNDAGDRYEEAWPRPTHWRKVI